MKAAPSTDATNKRLGRALNRAYIPRRFAAQALKSTPDLFGFFIEPRDDLRTSSTTMADFVSISEAADRLDVPPRRISDLLYNRKIDPKQLLVKGGRRFLPERLLPQIAKLLQIHLR